MTRTASHPPAVNLDDVQHFVMEDASWDLYEKLLRDIGDRPIRVTYDQGRMEIMSPLPEHEHDKKLIGGLIEMLAFELNMPMACLGSTTFRRKTKAKGLEPDECYYFHNEKQMRGKKRLDLQKDPPPELVVEIDLTSRSVPRQPIYAALGVPEIWRLAGSQLECLHLVGGEYRVQQQSLAFPFLEPALLKPFIDEGHADGHTAMLKSFVEWVRKNGWSK
ncbi:MAG TPA: Uma2 family endonuclease [Tepidisphaeraceae bacterium]|nr:Uma2 family endonuclease [Tepidisphaeraceae bacterium]